MKRHQYIQGVGNPQQGGDEINHGRDQDQGQHHCHQVEKEMRQGHAALLYGSLDRAQQDGAGGAQVAADDDGDRLDQGEDTRMQGGEDHHHGRGRGLDNGGEQRAAQEIHQQVVAAQKADVHVLLQGGERPGHLVQSQQQQAQSQQQIAQIIRPFTLAQKHRSQGAQGQGGMGEGQQVQLEPQKSHGPAGKRGPQVTAQDHPQGVAQLQDAGPDEGEDDKTHQGAALQEGGYGGAGDHAAQRRTGLLPQQSLHGP